MGRNKADGRITIDTKIDEKGFEAGSQKLSDSLSSLKKSIEEISEVVQKADTFIGSYRTSTALNVRKEANGAAEVVGVLPVGTTVACDGLYGMDGGTRYLHVSTGEVEGYAQVRFLIKTS